MDNENKVKKYKARAAFAAYRISGFGELGEMTQAQLQGYANRHPKAAGRYLEELKDEPKSKKKKDNSDQYAGE